MDNLRYQHLRARLQYLAKLFWCLSNICIIIIIHKNTHICYIFHNVL